MAYREMPRLSNDRFDGGNLSDTRDYTRGGKSQMLYELHSYIIPLEKEFQSKFINLITKHNHNWNAQYRIASDKYVLRLYIGDNANYSGISFKIIIYLKVRGRTIEICSDSVQFEMHTISKFVDIGANFDASRIIHDKFSEMFERIISMLTIHALETLSEKFSSEMEGYQLKEGGQQEVKQPEEPVDTSLDIPFDDFVKLAT